MNENKIPGGATLWARQTIDSKIFYSKPAIWFKIWFYLVNRVNHKKVRKWDRGECFIEYSEIVDKTSATIDQVKKCFQYLRRVGMIDTARSTRGVSLIIPKYSQYQSIVNYKNANKSTTQSTREALEAHQRSTTINNNDNNDNNEKKEKLSSSINYLKKIPIKDIEEFENKFNCSKYQTESKADDLINWCETNGKQKKDYKAFLRVALKKDFGVKAPEDQQMAERIKATKVNYEGSSDFSKQLVNKFKK